MASNHHSPIEPARQLMETYENRVAALEERSRRQEKALEHYRRAQDEMAYALGSAAATVDRAIAALEKARRRLSMAGEDE